MIKLVASDLDGTIIDKNNSIYDNNFKAIQDLNKHKMNFVICTGKTYPITKKVCQRINATYGIFGNGNQIINLKTGEEIYRNLLSRDIVLKCIDIAKKHGLHVHIYTDTNVISEELLYLDLRNYKLQTNTKSENSMEFNIVDNIKDFVLNNDISVCKLVVTSPTSTEEVKNEIVNSLDVDVSTIRKFGDYKDLIINKEYEYIDITPKNVNKNTALEILGNHLNIKTDEVLTIGDNLNDFDMVKNAGVGVAVANAYDELKAVANFTTTNPVEKGGFAEAVYKFIKF